MPDIPQRKRNDRWPLLPVDDIIDIAAHAAQRKRSVLEAALDAVEASREEERQRILDAPIIYDGVTVEEGGWYDVTFRYNKRPTRGLYCAGTAMVITSMFDLEEKPARALIHYGANPKPGFFVVPKRHTLSSQPAFIQRITPSAAQLAAREAHVKKEEDYQRHQEEWRQKLGDRALTGRSNGV